MGLPFNSNEFKAAVEKCKKQFSPIALAIYVKDMIDDYEKLLAASKSRKPKSGTSGGNDIPRIPMGDILNKHQSKIEISELPESITDGNKQHPVRENVNLYFNEIASLENLSGK